jgi:hypothetical protein
LTKTIASVGYTFAQNALELFGFGGNENGLCESGETRLVIANIGAYQGHGNLVDASTSVANTKACTNIGAGGTLQNITLKKYSVNGI